MTSLATWLLASALASPDAAFTEGFGGSNNNRAFFWNGPPGATVLVLGGQDFSPCTDRMGGECTGLKSGEVLFSTVLGPDGSAAAEYFLPKSLIGRDIALRVVAIDSASAPAGDLRPFVVSRPRRVHVFGRAQDPDRDGLSTRTESRIGTDPNVADTDGGGVPDGVEHALGTDPLLKRDDTRLSRRDRDGDGIDDDTERRHGTNPLNPDTDGDGLPDGKEVFEFQTDPLDPDTDHGGARDGDEVAFGANPLDPADDGFWFVDSDDDGLPDAEELRIGSDPFAFDTDGGGVSDGAEFAFGTDPTRAFDDAFVVVDSDGDGLLDHDEVALGTDPYAFDTDGGGVGDGEEFFTGRNPFDPSDDPGGHELVDTDGDGIPNGEELARGTSPVLWDTDGGGVGDGAEAIAGTDPLDRTDDHLVIDSDFDGVPDDVEIKQGSDPFDPDTDHGGRPDGAEFWAGTDVNDPSDDGVMPRDSDFDGLSDDDEINLVGTDPFNPDTDRGGVLDGEEWLRGTDPLDPADDGAGPPPDQDSDGDLLSDRDEVNVFGTDPFDPDTDKGGASDGYEVHYGMDPLDPTDDKTAPVDSDGDGVSNDDEAASGTDPYLYDTDGGGVPDGVELWLRLSDPLDPHDDFQSTDSDRDGITDADESNVWGTDPFAWDTDGGGRSDGDEVGRGLDPLDPSDDGQVAPPPPSPTP